MKKKLIMRAFSLMEMMIVLLIVAIIAAATAPMISKKMMRQAGTGDSPWVFTGTGNSIAFNMRGRVNDTVLIGANNVGNGAQNAPLYIRVDAMRNLQDLRNGNVAAVDRGQAITFEDNNRVVGHLGMTDQTTFFSNIIPAELGNGNDGTVIFGGNNTISRAEQDGRSNYVGNKILIGYQNNLSINDPNDNSQDIIIGSNLRNIALSGNNPANFEANIIIGQGNLGQSVLDRTIAIGGNQTLNGNLSRCVVVGDSASASGVINEAIAVGHRASVSGNSAIAVGLGATAINTDDIAIGHGAQAGINGNNSAVAVGAGADAQYSSSVAIGANAQAGDNNNNINSTASIAIGFRANAIGVRSIAIGGGDNDVANSQRTTVNGNNSIAIGGSDLNGNRTFALGNDSVAIGYGAQVGRFQAGGIVPHSNSVAIGFNAQTTGSNQIMLGQTGANAPTVVIQGTLRVNPANLQDLNGQRIIAQADGTLGSGISDIRLKNVGEKLTSGLEDIKKLEFFNYTFKDDKEQKPHVGVMAQDLQKVFPISVSEGSDGYLRIRWDEMFYAALNAIKELDNKITEIKTKVASYFDRVAKLEAQIDEQQKTIEELQKQNAEFKKRLAKIEKRGVGVKGVNNKIKTPALKSESEAE